MSLCGLRTFDIELLCLPSCEIIVLPYAGNHKEKSTWLLIIKLSISISAEQAGYPVAVYVRKSALDERIEVHYNITAELPELQKLIAEYSAIGNNLNQIAQYFHSGGFYSKSMQDEINRHLTALWQLRQEAIKLGGTYHGRVKTHRNKKR